MLKYLLLQKPSPELYAKLRPRSGEFGPGKICFVIGLPPELVRIQVAREAVIMPPWSSG